MKLKTVKIYTLEMYMAVNLISVFSVSLLLSEFKVSRLLSMNLMPNKAFIKNEPFNIHPASSFPLDLPSSVIILMT